MSTVWDSSIQDKTELLVLLALADFANEKGVAWPCLENLAEKSRCSVRNIQRVLKRLELAGILSITRLGGGPPGRSNFYQINLKSNRGDTMAQPDKGGVTEQGGGVTNEGGVGVTDRGGGVTELGQRSVSRSVSSTDPSVDPSCTCGFTLTGEEPEKGKKPNPETSEKFQEAIYQEYPHKVGKPAAMKAIEGALHRVKFKELLERTKAYAKSVRETGYEYIPYPQKWFNQERYNDDPSTWVRKNGSGQVVHPVTKMKLLQDEIDRHPANRESAHHDERKCTPARQQELKAMVAKLTNLKRTVVNV
jgi:hypothetical protein